MYIELFDLLGILLALLFICNMIVVFSVKYSKQKETNELDFPVINNIHKTGHVIIETDNIQYMKNLISDNTKLIGADLGIQIDELGKVWVCVNGFALLRFKPHNK